MNKITEILKSKQKLINYIVIYQMQFGIKPD